MTVPANPYAPGYPVAPNLFAGRQEALDALLRSFNSSRAGHLTNVFVEGEWGIGKTSILFRVRPQLEEAGCVIREDVVPDTKEDQFREFFSAVVNELSVVGAIPIDHLDHSGGRRGVRRTLQIIWSALKDRGHEVVVLMLDNVERAKAEFLSEVRDLFQYLRENGARYMLLFAGRSLPAGERSAANPTARFFQRLPIGPMTEAEGVEAIRKPLEVLGYEMSLTADAARLIYDRAAGHPFFLKSISSAVFEIARGTGEIDHEWLRTYWRKVEESLEVSKFSGEFADLSAGERETLLRASLLDRSFEAKDLRGDIPKSLDTYLRRLTSAGLLRRSGHGSYEIYHALFRSFLSGKAGERNLRDGSHRSVKEKRTALGRAEVEEIIERIAERQLDIVDEHFRGRAVSFLEAAGPGVRMRVLMAPDGPWPKTLRALGELELSIRKRVEVREWPKSDASPVPWHVRFIVGDKGAWEITHSLDGVGRKTTYFTDKGAARNALAADFERWWKESRSIFPSSS